MQPRTGRLFAHHAVTVAVWKPAFASVGRKCWFGKVHLISSSVGIQRSRPPHVAKNRSASWPLTARSRRTSVQISLGHGGHGIDVATRGQYIPCTACPTRGGQPLNGAGACRASLSVTWSCLPVRLSVGPAANQPSRRRVVSFSRRLLWRELARWRHVHGCRAP
jgi:hypothetical protein